MLIQPKLQINIPGDKYEQEADAMADNIIRTDGNGTAGSSTSSLIGPSVQRQCAECEEEKEKPLMRKAENGGYRLQAPSSLASSLVSSKGGGLPLPPGTRNFMENAFSKDFSSVRVHTGTQASGMNKGINARAFINGNDIYFNHGEFAPGRTEGKRLLAHELAHVVQQAPPEKISRKSYLQDQGITDATTVDDETKVGKIVGDTLSDPASKIYPYIKDKLGKLNKKLAGISIDDPAVYGHKYIRINNITDPTVTDEHVFDTIKGFIDPKKDDIYLSNRSNYCHAFHESLHTVSYHTAFTNNFGHDLMEGMTQYFTDVVFKEQTGDVCKTHNYQKELGCAAYFVSTVGFDIAAQIFFNGRYHLLMPILKKLNLTTISALKNYVLKGC